MSNNLTAKVAVDKLAYGCDILYSYLVPEQFEDLVKIGQRVIVPFGKGSTKRMGLVCELSIEKNDYNLKNIYAVPDKAPLVCDEMLTLIKWMKNHYFCTYFEAAKLVFPPGLSNGIDNIKYNINFEVLNSSDNLSMAEQKFIDKIISEAKNSITLKKLISLKIKNYNNILISLLSKKVLAEEFVLSKTVGEKSIKKFGLPINNIEIFSLTDKQKKVCDFLKNFGSATAKEICYFTGVGKSVIDKLFKNEIIISSEYLEYKSPKLSSELSDNNYNRNVLSTEQSRVFEAILKAYQKNKCEVSLIHGVTGSGKTEVLLRLIDSIVPQGKSAIFMVPEIALTAQFINLFRARYKEKAAVVHSGLSDWERLDTWKRIKSGEVQVVLGTRSAVFAPFDNLGLIVIDEEHEFTYKSESSPRFNAKDVAKYRCKYQSAMLIFSSATPSVESYFKATAGKYTLYSLKERYGAARLPDVNIVDMNKESIDLNTNQFSDELINSLKDNIKNKKQSIIFLNRRGYNTFVKCRSCGEVLTCPHCSVSLNYHKANNRLMCHYCGYSCELLIKCPACNQDKICHLGAGTQKAEDILSEIIPEAKILRMDSDTKNSKEPYDKVFKDFADGKYDILLGTQMISKGFNFPNVTLVGVLSADQYLYSADFRSYEKTFNLITQVVGRSGRDKFPGKAIIQTFSPENDILKLAAKQDYETFFENEIKIRKAMLYPPFADLCIVGFTGENENKVMNASLKFFKNIKKELAENHSKMPLRIFAPVPANVKKVSGKYRYRIVIKCRNDHDFRTMLSEQLINFSKEAYAGSVNIFVDINPDTIL